ncbi:terminase family protein [Exiguobacterium sp. s133]|uniref:terminase large subunit domain-containing protein n=1 Tax=Exiguobacterium sp. s133 TaxID=2751213 RepID=UPI00333CC42A
MTAIYCITRSVLFPRNKTAIISATKNQARMIVTEKIQKELMLYPNVAREIKDIKSSAGNTDVFFHNGSTITVVPNNDNARGIRANLLIADEAILLKVMLPRISSDRYRTCL